MLLYRYNRHHQADRDGTNFEELVYKFFFHITAAILRPRDYKWRKRVLYKLWCCYNHASLREWLITRYRVASVCSFAAYTLARQLRLNSYDEETDSFLLFQMQSSIPKSNSSMESNSTHSFRACAVRESRNTAADR